MKSDGRQIPAFTTNIPDGIPVIIITLLNCVSLYEQDNKLWKKSLILKRSVNTMLLTTVKPCTEELHFSSNYFGDLIKKETGKSAQEYIQAKIIDVAKNKIFDSSKTVNEIAYELGFKYPQHFIRLFKKRVGSTPNEYRSLN